MVEQHFIRPHQPTQAERETTRKNCEKSLDKKQEQLKLVEKELNLNDIDFGGFKYFFRVLKTTGYIPEKEGHYIDENGRTQRFVYNIKNYEEIICYFQERGIISSAGRLYKTNDNFKELDKKMNKLEEIVHGMHLDVGLINSTHGRPNIHY